MQSKLFSSLMLLTSLIFISVESVGAQSNFTKSGNYVTAGDVRFEILTPTLVRFEYSSVRDFVNAPTVVVANRVWKPVKFTVREADGWLDIATKSINVRYRFGEGKLTRDNLEVSWNNGKTKGSWSPGDSDTANLGGIAYSLDGISGSRLPEFQPGLLSRSGYFVLDDSRSPVWDTRSEWIVPRKENDSQDFYFFAYGNDYKHVLKEYSDLCGKIPMVPRYLLGTWITDLNYEYLPGSYVVDNFHFTDKELKDEIVNFKSEGIPLDVLVLDFAWHKFGWAGGYDWSPIFPDPQNFLAWARNEGIHVTVNDHPGYGGESVLSDKDSRAPEVRKILGMVEPAPSKFSMDIAKDWKFSLDPKQDGMNSGWYAVNFNDSAWQTLQGGMAWEDQGHPDYDGDAWYRKWVTMPSSIPRNVYAIFGGVDDQYDLFVNGAKVAHHGTPGNSVYNTLTSTDVASYLKPNSSNLIAVRVNDWGGNGGLTALPVLLSDEIPKTGIRFNLAVKKDAEVYMDVLHAPVMRDGVDFWWIDGGSGSCEMEGLNSQLWTNKIFYDYTQKFDNERGFVFSRYGGWGNNRYPGFFTGDTHSEWKVLAYEVPFTARAANVMAPYVTHDIGGFLGDSIGLDLYARWVEFGAFSPLFRLHCAYENPENGNMRMPWKYGDEAVAVAKKYLNLRERLIPYMYTYSRYAYDTGVPLVRSLYLEFPNLVKVYSFPNEYLFGDEFLVAPVVDSTGSAAFYLPPGKWVDYFSGESYEGNKTITKTYALDSMPLFVKAGSIVPLQQEMPYSSERPVDTLTIQVFGPAAGEFSLYEDDGLSMKYTVGQYEWTPMKFTVTGGGGHMLTIGPAKGSFKGEVGSRAYKVEIHGLSMPHSITLNGRTLRSSEGNGGGYSWDSRSSVIRVNVPSSSVKEETTIVVR